MIGKTAKPSALEVVIQAANPIFVVLAIGIPLGALAYALISGVYVALKYTHIMSGALWTGIDLFMGLVLGPTLGAMAPGERAAVFKRLVPKMTFLMPALATVTITAGMQLAERLGLYSMSNPWIVAALVIAAILTIQGFGLLLPNEIRVFRQLLSPTPDIGVISRLGMRNAKLGGIQGLLQLAIIFIMVNLRF